MIKHSFLFGSRHKRNTDLQVDVQWFMIIVINLEAKETHTYLDEVLAKGIEHMKNERRAPDSRSSNAII
jgi:hypothetical protein